MTRFRPATVALKEFKVGIVQLNGLLPQLVITSIVI